MQSMPLQRFGKSSKSLREMKSNFTSCNAELALKQQRINDIYTNQPRRTNCKNCGVTLNHERDFVIGSVPYYICVACTHLNGGYEDTDDFCKYVYVSGGGIEYAESYTSNDIAKFSIREKEVYVPKAAFLIDALEQRGEEPYTLRISDFGCGAGYLVSALRSMGLNASGIDVSEALIHYGQSARPALPISCIPEIESLYSEAEQTTANIICLIGVLEHLQAPNRLLTLIKNNLNVRYLFISVPLFSPSALFDTLFVEQFHRHLGSAHTHLYTSGSLAHLEAYFGFSRIAEWWFGLDVTDLYRCMSVRFREMGCSASFLEVLEDRLGSCIDELQLVLDSQKNASEVHLVLEICRS